jgi:hypothetical protein
MSGVPVLQDEVNRKAVDTLIWLGMSLHHGKISVDQFSTGVDALFMAVSGLVTDKDWLQMIGEAQYIIENERKKA